MGTRVSLEMVRLSYPHLFQPRAVNPGDTPKYGAALLIPKFIQTAQGPAANPAIAQLQAAEQAERATKWGANVPPTAKPLPLYDGDTDPKYAGQPEYAGVMILNTSAQDQPVIVDQNLQKVMNPATFYSGCFVNADIGVYPYDQPMSKGTAAGLNGVQFVADGERIDGRPSAEQMFGAPAGAPAPVAPGVGQTPAVQPVAQPVPSGAPQPGYQAGQPAAYPAGVPAQAPAAAPAQPATPVAPGTLQTPNIFG